MYIPKSVLFLLILCIRHFSFVCASHLVWLFKCLHFLFARSEDDQRYGSLNKHGMTVLTRWSRVVMEPSLRKCPVYFKDFTFTLADKLPFSKSSGGLGEKKVVGKTTWCRCTSKRIFGIMSELNENENMTINIWILPQDKFVIWNVILHNSSI